MKSNGSKEVSRRDFLKSAAAATAAAATVGVARPGYVAEGGPMKVGIVGCGGRGTGAAGNAIQAGNAIGADVQVVALGDAFQDKIDRCKRSLQRHKNRLIREKSKNIRDDLCFVGVDNYKKVIAQDLDYVILATPPGWRPLHFEEVVRAKRNCFCEKPVATDPVGIQRYMAAAKRSEQLGLSITVGTQRRHSKDYRETIKKIKDGKIGEILAARAYWCSKGAVFKERERKPEWSDLEWQLRAWYSYCWICGDNIVEQHIHNLDIINWVMGTHPTKAVGSGGRSWKSGEPGVGDIFDHFTIDYTYPNGVHMLSMCRHWYSPWGSVSEAVVGTKGTSNCHDMQDEGKGLGGMVQEHVDLILSIMKQEPHYNEAVQVCESTGTAILGREAAYSGRELTWDDMMNSKLSILPKNLSFNARIPEPPVPTPGKPGWKRGV